MAGPGGTIILTNGDDVFPGVGDDNSGDEAIIALDGDDTVSGGIGNDDINGGLGNDTLNGNEGDDRLIGEAGDDLLNGGSGFDIAYYFDFSLSDGINIDLRVETQAANPGRGIDRLISIEGVYGTALNDVITGNDFANSLFGSEGSDILRGGGGDDTISDSALFSETVNIDGGTGNDIVSLASDASATGTLSGGLGTDTLLADINPFGATHLELIAISSFEVLEANVRPVSATAAQYEAFDIIRVSTTEPAGTALLLASSGSPQIVDLSDELNAGGNPNGAWIIGSSDDETITASDRNDTILGGLGNDTLNGRGGDDILQGGPGNDLLNGGSGFDIADYDHFTVTSGVNIDLRVEVQASSGEHGADRLISIEGVRGTLFDDVLIGNDLDNRLDGRAGADMLIGGGGNDLISDDAQGFVTPIGHSIDAGAGNDTVTLSYDEFVTSGTISGGLGIDTLVVDRHIDRVAVSGFETLETLSFGVVATAAQLEAFNIIRSNATGPAAEVLLFLASTGGSQTLDLSDELNSGGAPRRARIFGSSDNETITTGDGNDDINGGFGNDTLIGGIGNDTLDGSAGNDTIRGGLGKDTIVDTDGATTDIDAGNDDDLVKIGETFTSGTLVGGAGSDTLEAIGFVDLRPLNFTGFEFLNTGHVVYTVTATAAQFEAFKTIRVNAADPAGMVTLIVGAIGAAQTLDLSDELNSGGGPRGVFLSGSTDNESFTAGDGNDQLYGAGGDDMLRGGRGNDFIVGGLGNDALDGGRGDDVLLGNEGNDTANGGDGNDQLSGAEGDDTLNGGLGDDTLDGQAGNDVIRGGAGNDFIRDSGGTTADIDGGSGDDILDLSGIFGGGSSGFVASGTLSGGSGIDTLENIGNLESFTISGFEILHASGNVTGRAAQFDSFDTIRVDATNSTLPVNLTIAAIGAAQTVDLSDELNSAGGPRALYLTGSTDGDTVIAGNGDDYLVGNDGNDVLIGGNGHDRLEGMLGHDVLGGGGGDDFLSDEQGNDTLNGGAGLDYLSGGLGNDRLDGGAGNDFLFGGAGIDISTGRAGGDTFFFEFASDGGIGEQIGDFVSGADRIRIDASNFGGGLVEGTLAASKLVVAAAPVATQAFGQFLYNTATGLLSWDADGTGAGAAVTLVKLFNPTFAGPPGSLGLADFEIVA